MTSAHTEESRISQLRNLLIEPPSQALWKKLRELFYDWPAGDERDVGMEYARSHLEQWSPTLRPAFTTYNSPLWPLVKTLDLSYTDIESYRQESLKTIESLRNIDTFILRYKSWLQLPKEIKKRFRNIKHLTLIHCNRKRVGHKIKMSFEEEDLPQLQSLTLRHCETLSNIHGLAKLPRLESLSLHSLPAAFDTSCLQAATQLRELTFHHCTFLDHVDFLNPFNRLEKLIIQGVSDLRSIESFTNLESLRSLYITDGKDIPHLTPLEQLTWLEDVEIRSISKVSTFPSLTKLTRLKRLILPQATSLYTLNVQNESLEEFYVSGLYWTHSIHMETPSLQHCTFKDTRSLRKHGSRKNRPADTVITYGSEMPKLRYLHIEESPQFFQSHTPTEIQEHIQEAFTWVAPSA